MSNCIIFCGKRIYIKINNLIVVIGVGTGVDRKIDPQF